MSVRYRADIDGLRALAVLCVLAFHLGMRAVPGGYTGVDVFFVISGYLIARIIYSDVDAGRFSLAAFYERRIRRIQPALLVMIVCTTLAGAVLLTPVDFKRLAQSLGAALLSCSNVYFYLKSGYFDPAAETQPLLHTWSLAVEEQYYLLFPLLPMLFARRPTRWLVATLVTLALTSFLAGCMELRHDPEGAFYLPFGRTWELLTGALLARAPRMPRLTPHVWTAIGAAGLLAVLCAALLYSPETRFPGPAALLPVLGAAALIASGCQTTTGATRILSAAPLVAIGRISYSLYLWHWPVLVLLRYALFHEPTPLETTAYLIAVGLLAWLSWRFIEQPLRLRALLAHRRAVFGASAAAALAGLGFAIAVQAENGFPQRFPEPARRYAAAALDVNPRRQQCDSRRASAVAAGSVCALGPATEVPRFALIGDSFADALSPGFDKAADALGIAGVVLTHGGCVPLLAVQQGNDECAPFYEAARHYVDMHPSIQTVVLVGRWSAALLGTRFGQYAARPWYITDAQSTQPGYAENRRVFVRGFERTLQAFGGRRIVVLAYIPEQRYDVPRALALSSIWGYPAAVALPFAAHQARQAQLRRVLGQLQLTFGFELLDVGESLCAHGQCPVLSDGTVLYADDNHLSRSASEHLATLWQQALTPMRSLQPLAVAVSHPSGNAIHGR